jgi:hypothetical protein
VKSREAREVAQADTLMGHVRTAGDRSERLYAAAETILDRTLQAGDFKTALQGIRAAADVLKEARAYLELRGEITGELNPPPAAPSFGPSALLSVIIMPKTPEAEAEERRILAKFERLPALPGFAPPSSGSGPLRLGPKRSKATDDTRKEG